MSNRLSPPYLEECLGQVLGGSGRWVGASDMYAPQIVVLAGPSTENLIPRDASPKVIGDLALRLGCRTADMELHEAPENMGYLKIKPIRIFKDAQGQGTHFLAVAVDKLQFIDEGTTLWFWHYEGGEYDGVENKGSGDFLV